MIIVYVIMGFLNGFSLAVKILDIKSASFSLIFFHSLKVGIFGGGIVRWTRPIKRVKADAT